MDPFDQANDLLSGDPELDAVDDGLSARAGGMFGRYQPPEMATSPHMIRPRGGERFQIDTPPSAQILQPRDFAQADLIAQRIAQALAQSSSTPIRPPSHTCPPVRAIDFDHDLRPAAAYTVIAASAVDSIFLTLRLNQSWYGTLIGIGWVISWDTGLGPGDPYLSARVSLRVNGEIHPTFSRLTAPVTNSTLVLAPVTIPINPLGTTQDGSLIELVITNTDATNAMRVVGRVKGYQFPVAGQGDGIRGGQVEG